MFDFRQFEASAFEAQNCGDFSRAINLWKEILTAYPNWEHGYAHYQLANCYVDTGETDLAIEAYKSAVALAPEDSMFSDALNSLQEARNLGHF